jgi:hypothetical protein
MNIFTYQTFNIYLVDLRFMNQSNQNRDLRRSKRNLQSNSALAVSSPTQSGGLNDKETNGRKRKRKGKQREGEN